MGMVLQLDYGTDAIHQLDRVEKRLQSSVIDHLFVKAEYVAVPLDLSRKVCHRNTDMIELESRWFQIRSSCRGCWAFCVWAKTARSNVTSVRRDMSIRMLLQLGGGFPVDMRLGAGGSSESEPFFHGIVMGRRLEKK